jgi:hypothetical protein
MACLPEKTADKALLENQTKVFHFFFSENIPSTQEHKEPFKKSVSQQDATAQYSETYRVMDFTTHSMLNLITPETQHRDFQGAGSLFSRVVRILNYYRQFQNALQRQAPEPQPPH